MDESNNCLEILLNLLYLARHSGEEAEAIDYYLAQAEKQAMRLADIERAMALNSQRPEDKANRSTPVRRS